MIGRSHKLLRHQEEDVTETFYSLLEDEGIELALDARNKQVSGKSGRLASMAASDHNAQSTRPVRQIADAKPTRSLRLDDPGVLDHSTTIDPARAVLVELTQGAL